MKRIQRSWRRRHTGYVQKSVTKEIFVLEEESFQESCCDSDANAYPAPPVGRGDGPDSAGTATGETNASPHGRGQEPRSQPPMFSLLTDPLIRVVGSDGSHRLLSLPEVYEAMAADLVLGFPALRPHQRHAWHAFLAQLGVLALVGAGRTQPPSRAREWHDLLRELTPDFPSDEPWRLVVADTATPAFMQCPTRDGLGAFKKAYMTPDDLDLLATAKNHDVKSSVASHSEPDDWLFALISLQTMSGYLGAGNHRIARMNGGYSSRPCLGLKPAEGGMGAHLVHDIRRMIESRDALLEEFPAYFKPEDGVALVWIEPWDGMSSLRVGDLDPHFIEVCRRIRLVRRGGRVVGLAATSKKPRIAAGEAHGDLGDHWVPVSRDGKALSLSRVGFRYDRLAEMILDEKAYRHPASMKVDVSSSRRWHLVARGVAAGQGKTEGYYERADIVFGPRLTRLFLGGDEGRRMLSELSKAQIAEIRAVSSALGFAIAVGASGGKDAASLTKVDRQKASPFLRRLDSIVDARFFSVLQERLGQQGLTMSPTDDSPARRSFVEELIRDAKKLLREALDSIPCARIHRYRSRARANSAFWSRLRRSDIVGDLFDTPPEQAHDS